MAKHGAHSVAVDWDLVNNFKARRVVAALKKSLPGGWGGAVEILAVHPVDLPVWLRSSDWLARVEDFKAKHGGALEWNLDDGTICQKSKEFAEWAGQLLELKSNDTSDAEKLDKVCAVCDLVGVDWPVSVTALGAVNRVLSAVWWRRSLRRKVARVVEAGAIKLGLVSKNTGGYASDGAVKRRREQVARNAAMMDATLLQNEAGQVFKLSDLAARSTANPEVRGDELMTRIRGCEEFASMAGHVGYFLTGTCPSSFHAVRVESRGPRSVVKPNPHYDGISTPRDAQMWLRDKWAKTRAQWAREGVEVYGFRVAEPHHDGCPHWHLLLWFVDDVAARRGLSTFGQKWLSDGGMVDAYPCAKNVIVFKGAAGSDHEKGALKNRVNFKRMVGGGAAGYVAKYIAKSIGHHDIGVQLDTLDGKTWELDTREIKGWHRVDAWAATWGIRQFQAIGQPSVTVWRNMRRVTKDQVDTAIHGGDGIASKVWHAVHKFGQGVAAEVSLTGREVKPVAADWCRYMVHQGGAGLKRTAYKIQTAMRIEPDYVNGYGEPITKKTAIGCELPSGRVLVSRRQSWSHVGAEVCTQTSEEREALAAPWTRFNNCTARLTGQLRAALLGLESEGLGYLAGACGVDGYFDDGVWV